MYVVCRKNEEKTIYENVAAVVLNDHTLRVCIDGKDYERVDKPWSIVITDG